MWIPRICSKEPPREKISWRLRNTMWDFRAGCRFRAAAFKCISMLLRDFCDRWVARRWVTEITDETTRSSVEYVTHDESNLVKWLISHDTMTPGIYTERQRYDKNLRAEKNTLQTIIRIWRHSPRRLYWQSLNVSQYAEPPFYATLDAHALFSCACVLFDSVFRCIIYYALFLS